MCVIRWLRVCRGAPTRRDLEQQQGEPAAYDTLGGSSCCSVSFACKNLTVWLADPCLLIRAAAQQQDSGHSFLRLATRHGYGHLIQLHSCSWCMHTHPTSQVSTGCSKLCARHGVAATNIQSGTTFRNMTLLVLLCRAVPWRAVLAQIPNAHAIGVTAVSWAPAVPSGSMVGSQPPSAPVKRLCTAGCDNTVKVGLSPLC